MREEDKSQYMLRTPKLVSRSHEPDQLEMVDSYFSEENQTSLVQASQIPVITTASEALIPIHH